MPDYPRTIDNGAGEQLTFLGVRRDGRGEYGEARNIVSPGAGPPMHVHHLQDEGSRSSGARWATRARAGRSTQPARASR
jgi:hypothetical protein